VKDFRWATRPLAELVEFQRGLTYKKSDEVPFSGNAVLRANNIDRLTGLLNLDEIRYIRDDVEVHDRLKVRPGTLLICTASGSKSHLGKVALVEEAMDFAFGGFMGLIIPEPSLDPRYLFYVTRSSLYDDFIDSLSDGANINNLKFSDLGKFAVPLPPLEEQQRIVAVLDQVFAALDRARALAEANLADAEALLAEARETLLDPSQTGWAMMPLSELIRIKHGFAFKSEYFTDSGDLVLLTPGNFFEGGGYRDRGSKQKYYEGIVPIGFVLQRGDLLMAMTEQAPGLLGSCILVPEDDRFLHNQRLGLIQPRSKDWHSPYFAHVFSTKAFRKALSDSCTGIKVRHTSPDKIMAVSVPVPASRDEQVDVAAKLDALVEKVQSLKDDLRLKLGELADLRQSLLQKAFAGELT
jgi:type I restriction enzyme S subunit